MKATSPWQKHAPFILFMAALFLLAYYLDQHLSAFLPAFHAARILIQLALAATVIAILRNVVGIRAFGTFAPVIIAFSMLFSGLLVGLLLFGAVVLVLILTRSAIHGQHIQQSHRAAIMVLMVALVAILLTAFASRLGQPEIAFVLLFPVIITSWVADQFLTRVSQVGWGPPTRALLWTLLLVAVAYVVITQAWLVDLVITEPMSWPLIVLLNWSLGTRVKMRLSDRLRFRPLKRMEDVLLQGGVSATVLTITQRNREYVDRYNPPGVMGSLNKARAKALLMAEGIPVPENYALISTKEGMDEAVDVFLQTPTFVIKPASGYGGEGILVVTGRQGKLFVTSQGLLGLDDLVSHLRSLLEGDYNLEKGDEVLIEALLTPHEFVKPFAPKGVPDVRILGLLGHPVMAMLRLPTLESQGKANLHLGAVGVGVELATGTVRFGTWKGEIVSRHPDTGARLTGFEVPFWEQILEIASEAQQLSGLGFAGVDVVLDAQRGPLVLEVNRRPGLEIQKANGVGLLPRLRAIEEIPRREEPVQVRVLRAMELDRMGWASGGERRSEKSEDAEATLEDELRPVAPAGGSGR
ncbi:MAG: sugar-transfer associated ATP-grasp domain-containing protein [Thermoplasmata archaeon]